MMLQSLFLSSIVPLWNLFLLSIFVACLLLISFSNIHAQSTCSSYDNGIFHHTYGHRFHHHRNVHTHADAENTHGRYW